MSCVSCYINNNILKLYPVLFQTFQTLATLTPCPQVPDQELNFYMQQLSSAHTGEFDNLAALKELYIYVNKYYSDIMATLDESPTARKLGLGHKLKSLAMSVYPQSSC
jgi:hypothetical protein